MSTSANLLLVNKQHPLSKDYIPYDLVPVSAPFLATLSEEKRKLCRHAALAFRDMAEEMKKNSLLLYGISGYRSYKRQEEIFQQSLTQKGVEHTLAYIAKPGESEHQSGLAIDVSSPSCQYELEESFCHTKEYQWLLIHAHSFGFIFRYPKGKENITGFSFEPWHLRYVGIPAAKSLYQNHLVLEEYWEGP